MTRAEVSERVAKDTGFSVEQCDIIILSLISVLRKYIMIGTTISIRGLGVFKWKYRKEKRAYDISHKKSVIVDSHYIPYFKFAEDIEKTIEDETKGR